MQTKIPCVLMRGGTSKRPLFKASDLKDREIPSRPRPETRAVPPLIVSTLDFLFYRHDRA